MIKLLYSLSLVLFMTCTAQNKPANINYYSTGSNRRVTEFIIKEDTLKMLEKLDGNLVKQIIYNIHKSERRGKYELLYVEKTFPLPGPKAINPPPPYGLIVIYFSTDRNQLLVLHEDKPAYPSLEDCEKAFKDSSSFKQKYFFTYYSSSLFKSFANYKSFNNADSVTVKNILDEFVSTLKVQGPIMVNTKIQTLLGVTFMEDVLKKELIEKRINPAVTMGEFSKKMNEYHIVPPRLAPITPSTNSVARTPDTANGKRGLIAPPVSF